MNTKAEIKMKDIAGYENLYAITEDGRVWSYKSKKFLKPWLLRKSYLMVDLSKDGKSKHKRIHRLVLETYNPVVGMESLQVNHIDENKLNNNLSNLEWTTPKENVQHSLHNRVGKKRGKIRKIEQYSLDGELIAIYKNQAEAARQTNTYRLSIVDVLHGRTNTANGYIWRYHDEGQNTKENAGN